MDIACIIDDDPIQVLLLERTLCKQKLCKRLYVFKNGLEALNHLKAIIDDPALFPDIIFLDLNMPVLDGWGFLEEFKNLRSAVDKSVRLYIVSSSVWQKDIDKAKGVPEVTDFIIKPISINQLFRVMDSGFLSDSA